MKAERIRIILKITKYLLPVILLLKLCGCNYGHGGVNIPTDTTGVNVIAVAEIENGKTKIIADGYFPRVLPNSNKVFYSTAKELSVINIDGKDAKVLLKSPLTSNQYSFTPDGEKVLITVYNGSGIQLCIMNNDGTGLTKLLDMKPASDPLAGCSPKMDKIVVVNGYELATIDLTGSNYKVLRAKSDSTYFIHPRFLPDNDRIIYCERYKTSSNAPHSKDYIKILTLSTGKEITLGRYDVQSEFDISKDEKILFTDWPDVAKITVIDLKNNYKSTVLATGAPWSSLSPDGKKVVYSGQIGINIVNIDGTGTRNIVPPSDTVRAEPYFSSDGRLIVHEAVYHKKY